MIVHNIVVFALHVFLLIIFVLTYEFNSIILTTIPYITVALVFGITNNDFTKFLIILTHMMDLL